MSNEIRTAARAAQAAQAAERQPPLQGERPKELAPLILGGGLAAYSLVRAFHEQYRFYTTVLGRSDDPLCSGSKLCACLPLDDADAPGQVRRFTGLAGEIPVLVLPADHAAAAALARMEDRSGCGALVCAPSGDALAQFMDAGRLAALCSQAGLTPGGGPPTHLITGYSDRHGRVRLLSCSEILLQAGDVPLVVNAVFADAASSAVGQLMDRAGWTGFFQTGLRLSDGGPPILTGFSPCAGSTAHTLTALGQNPAWWAVEDLFYRSELPYVVTTGHCLWRIITPRACKARLSEEGQFTLRGMLGFGAVCNPVYAPGDSGLGRRLALRRERNRLDTLK